MLSNSVHTKFFPNSTHEIFSPTSRHEIFSPNYAQDFFFQNKSSQKLEKRQMLKSPSRSHNPSKPQSPNITKKNNTKFDVPQDKCLHKNGQKFKTIMIDDTTVISQMDKKNEKYQMKINLAKRVDHVPKSKTRQMFRINEKKLTFSFYPPIKKNASRYKSTKVDIVSKRIWKQKEMSRTRHRQKLGNLTSQHHPN